MSILSTVTGTFVKDLLKNGTDRQKSEFWKGIEGEVIKMLKAKLYKDMDPREYISRVYDEMVSQIDTYDFEKYSFSSFMHFMVKDAVYHQRMEDDYTISIPREMHALRCKAIKRESDFFALNGYEPSLETLADDMGEELDKLSLVFVNDGMEDLDERIGNDDDFIRKGDLLAAPVSDEFESDDFQTDLGRIMACMVGKGIVEENAAKAMLELHSPEGKMVFEPQIDDVIYHLGYKSAPALRYHLGKINDFLAHNPATRELLRDYLPKSA